MLTSIISAYIDIAHRHLGDGDTDFFRLLAKALFILEAVVHAKPDCNPPCCVTDL
jgi:hypothetical protein